MFCRYGLFCDSFVIFRLHSSVNRTPVQGMQETNIQTYLIYRWTRSRMQAARWMATYWEPFVVLNEVGLILMDKNVFLYCVGTFIPSILWSTCNFTFHPPAGP